MGTETARWVRWRHFGFESCLVKTKADGVIVGIGRTEGGANHQRASGRGWTSRISGHRLPERAREQTGFLELRKGGAYKVATGLILRSRQRADRAFCLLLVEQNRNY